MDVVLGQAQLIEVAPDRLGRDPGLAQGRHRRALRALGELLAVLPEDQPVVDELGRRGAQGLEEPAVDRLVRPVIVAAHYVRDPEVDVVDDARQVVRRAAIFAE